MVEKSLSFVLFPPRSLDPELYKWLVLLVLANKKDLANNIWDTVTLKIIFPVTWMSRHLH